MFWGEEEKRKGVKTEKERCGFCGFLLGREAERSKSRLSKIK